MKNPPETFKPVTLTDLASESRLLWCYCKECCREKEINPVALGLPLATPVPRVGSVMVCSKCGSRNIVTTPQLHTTPLAEIRAASRANQQRPLSS